MIHKYTAYTNVYISEYMCVCVCVCVCWCVGVCVCVYVCIGLFTRVGSYAAVSKLQKKKLQLAQRVFFFCLFLLGPMQLSATAKKNCSWHKELA